MKKKWLLPLFILVVLLFPGLVRFGVQFCGDIQKASAVQHVKGHQLALQEFLSGLPTSGEQKYRGWEVEILEDGTVKFQISYTGFASEMSEKGVLYAEVLPERLMGMRCAEKTPDGNWYRGEGDNYVLIQQITDRWFWYEQHW